MRDLVKCGKHRGLTRDMGRLIEFYENGDPLKIRMDPIYPKDKKTIEEFNKMKENKIKQCEESIKIYQDIIENKIPSMVFVESPETKLDETKEDESELMEMLDENRGNSMSFDQILEEAKRLNDETRDKELTLIETLDRIPSIVRTKAHEEMSRMVNSKIGDLRKRIEEFCSIPKLETKYKELYFEEVIEGNFLRNMLNMPCKIPVEYHDGFLSSQGIQSYLNHEFPKNLFIEGADYVEVDENQDDDSDVSTEYFSD